MTTMNLVKFCSFNNSFDLLNSFMNEFHVNSFDSKNLIPKANIYEENDEFIVEAEVPGIKKENISLEIKNNTLCIDTKNNYEDKVEGNKYYIKEIIDKNYSRSFYIPKNIDTEKLTANLEDGILKIKLPKSEEVKPKQIPIN